MFASLNRGKLFRITTMTRTKISRKRKKSDFFEKVNRFVKKIPRGKVVTYGQVASEIGYPRAARLVGWALAKLSSGVPWQRVVNREGMISIENLQAPKELQMKLLRKEGVKVEKVRENWYVDLKRYQWKP